MKTLQKILILLSIILSTTTYSAEEWKWVHAHNNGGEWWVHQGKASVIFKDKSFNAKLYITEDNHTYLARTVIGKMHKRYKISATLDFKDTDIGGIKLEGTYDQRSDDYTPHAITILSDYELVGLTRK